MVQDPIHKRIADYVAAEFDGCSFVGISSDNEVFLTFIKEDPELMAAAKIKVKDFFAGEISKITTVVTVSIEEVTQLVDGLNQALEDMEEKKPQLLDIGSF